MELEPLEPIGERSFFRWRYSRRNKLSMSGLNKKRKALHRGLVQYYCAREAAGGVDLKKVSITRYKRHALGPRQARRSRLPEQRDQVIDVGSYRCR